MKRVVLPAPPDPSTPAFAGSPQSWQRAAFSWMQQAKQLLDDANRVNAAPMGQQFVVTTGFTTNTTIGAASSAADVRNFVASLVASMTTAGYVAPVRERTSQ